MGCLSSSLSSVIGEALRVTGFASSSLVILLLFCRGWCSRSPSAEEVIGAASIPRLGDDLSEQLPRRHLHGRATCGSVVSKATRNPWSSSPLSPRECCSSMAMVDDASSVENWPCHFWHESFDGVGVGTSNGFLPGQRTWSRENKVCGCVVISTACQAQDKCLNLTAFSSICSIAETCLGNAERH